VADARHDRQLRAGDQLRQPLALRQWRGGVAIAPDDERRKRHHPIGVGVRAERDFPRCEEVDEPVPEGVGGAAHHQRRLQHPHALVGHRAGVRDEQAEQPSREPRIGDGRRDERVAQRARAQHERGRAATVRHAVEADRRVGQDQRARPIGRQQHGLHRRTAAEGVSDQRRLPDVERVEDTEDAPGLVLTPVGAMRGTRGIAEGRQVHGDGAEAGRGGRGERLAPELAPRAHTVHEQHDRRRRRAELLDEDLDVGGAHEPAALGRRVSPVQRLPRVRSPPESSEHRRHADGEQHDGEQDRADDRGGDTTPA